MPIHRALILDLDGTVVDSHPYTCAAFRSACSGWGVVPSDAEIFAAFGPSERIILRGLLPAAAVEAAYGRLQAYYAEHVDGLAVHAAMRPLLQACRAAGVRTALFTGRGGDSTALILRRLDLEWAFDAVLAGDAVRRPKPAPDGVLQLLATLDCTAGETLVVGDSRLDVEAATAAGAGALFAAWHPGAESHLPTGVPVLSHPDDLRPWLGLPPRRVGC